MTKYFINFLHLSYFSKSNLTDRLSTIYFVQYQCLLVRDGLYPLVNTTSVTEKCILFTDIPYFPTLIFKKKHKPLINLQVTFYHIGTEINRLVFIPLYDLQL